jgi:hypothetical protein
MVSNLDQFFAGFPISLYERGRIARR